MAKQKNKNENLKIGYNYSVKIPIKENLILKFLKKLKKVSITILIILAIILFFLAMYNKKNNYIWFSEQISQTLGIISFVIIVVCPILWHKFGW